MEERIKQHFSNTGFLYEELFGVNGHECSFVRCPCANCKNEFRWALKIKQRVGVAPHHSLTCLVYNNFTPWNQCDKNFGELVNKEPLLILFLNYRYLMREYNKINNQNKEIKSQLEEQTKKFEEKDKNIQNLSSRNEISVRANKELRLQREEQTKKVEEKEKIIQNLSSKSEKLDSVNKELKLKLEEQTKKLEEKEKNIQNLSSKSEELESINKELKLQLGEQTTETVEKEKNFQNLKSQFKKVQCLNSHLKEHLMDQIFGIPKKGEEQKQTVADIFSADKEEEIGSNTDKRSEVVVSTVETGINVSKGELQDHVVTTNKVLSVSSENDPKDPSISRASGQEVSRKRKINHESGEYVEEPECKKEVDDIIDNLAEQLIDQKKLLITFKAEKSKLIAKIDRGTQNLSNIRDRLKVYCQKDQE